MSVEAFVRNRMKEGKPSNFEILRERARETFSLMDMEEISRRTGTPIEDGHFRAVLLSDEYLVSTSGGTVTLSDGSPAGSSETMIIYDLLGYAREGASASGEYTQIQNLSGVVTGSKYAGQGMFAAYEKRMDGRDSDLARACEKLGGVPWGKGDVSYSIPVYRDLRTIVSFWDSDDEFPPSLIMMADTNTIDFMHYETLWYLAGVIARRLADEMDRTE